ncbi:MAG: DUF998 domain-containing protein [Dehalococcoidia bacterium]
MPLLVSPGFAAGVCLLVAGCVILMGIITAEATYPATYTTFDNEISDLGATRPPDSIIRQPSARIFNTTMLASGALILAGASFLRLMRVRRGSVIAVGLLGLGVLGVGVFPGNYGAIHPVFALTAFVSGGISGIVVTRWVEPPFRLLSVALGAITLAALVSAFLGDLTPLVDALGDGGIERWIAYPVVLWLVAFGGYLLGPRQPQA